MMVFVCEVCTDPFGTEARSSLRRGGRNHLRIKYYNLMAAGVTIHQSRYPNSKMIAIGGKLFA